MTKIRVAIVLPEALVREIDKLSRHFGSRSAVVEQSLRAFLYTGDPRVRDARDIEILSRNAEELNAEAIDVLRYQASPIDALGTDDVPTKWDIRPQ